MSWPAKFDDPISADGNTILTLKDAASYILRLSKREASEPHWQLAMEQLIDAAEGRNFVMHARIAMMRALNFGKPGPTRERKAKAYRIVR